MISLVSFRAYISEKSKCSFHISTIKDILMRKAGRVLVKVSRSSKELGLARLNIRRVMAMPNTASVRLSSLDAFWTPIGNSGVVVSVF